MGIYTPPKYRQKKNGVWIWVQPEPIDMAKEKNEARGGRNKNALRENKNGR